MKQEYNKIPQQVIDTKNRSISIFSTDGKNIDAEVVKTFGDEWLKFKDYSDEEIRSVAVMYFDILNEKIINKNTYAMDIGCGTGRWTKFLSDKVGFIEAVDPSDAVFAADELLKSVDNVRITKASVETIPFNDETFDFAMSIGVLHHIPNTQDAMIDCVKKVKKGGYFYCYLYYNLENRGIAFDILFWLSNILRKVVSRLSPGIKKTVCDILAVILYMPFVYLSRLLSFLGFKKLGKKIPLSDYADKSFFIIRNDSLDRFGTTLEQRFSKHQVIELMEKSGLKNIVVSPASPYYHAVGEKI
ncbi:MAG TPA: class I SAM-dependent methyltransferase [Ferruginibacter sp.]|nr:class I SAM-dependent methyltransferase [Ferruginibacter sp.]